MFARLREDIRIVFDRDPAVIGSRHGGVKVENVSRLAPTVLHREITIAALCVPPEAAQELTDHLVGARIRGILNYTRQRLRVPANVHVQDRQVICSFMQVACLSRGIPAGGFVQP